LVYNISHFAIVVLTGLNYSNCQPFVKQNLSQHLWISYAQQVGRILPKHPCHSAIQSFIPRQPIFTF